MGVVTGATSGARARVRVSFGKPVRFEPGTGYAEATTILEQAVREA